MAGLVRRGGREAGQATVEYVGAVLVALALILVVIATATSGGRQVACEVLSKISEAVGGSALDCGDASAEEDSHAPQEPCVLSESSRTRTVTASVMFVDAATGATITVSELSDGTYEVSATNTGNIGVSEGVGGGLEVTVDGKTYGAAASASIGAGVDLETTVTYNVDSAEEAEQLRAYLQQNVDEENLKTAGGILGWGYEAFNWTFDRNGARSYTPPEPTSVTTAGGATGNAAASGTLGPEHAGAEASVSQMLGVTQSPGDGTTTTFYKVTGEVGADGNIFFPGGSTDPGTETPPGSSGGGSGDASAEVELIFAVTTDKNGEPIETSIRAMHAESAEWSPLESFGDDASDPLSGGRVYEAKVDLTQPGTDKARALASMVASTNPLGAALFLDDYLDEAREHGTVTAQDVDADSVTDFGFNLSGEVAGIGLGGGYTDESSTKDYSNGRYLEGDKWLPWEGCE